MSHKIGQQHRNAFVDKKQLWIYPLHCRGKFSYVGLKTITQTFLTLLLLIKPHFAHCRLFCNNILHDVILKFPDSIIILPTTRSLEGDPLPPHTHTPPCDSPDSNKIHNSFILILHESNYITDTSVAFQIYAD